MFYKSYCSWKHSLYLNFVCHAKTFSLINFFRKISNAFICLYPTFIVIYITTVSMKQGHDKMISCLAAVRTSIYNTPHRAFFFIKSACEAFFVTSVRFYQQTFLATFFLITTSFSTISHISHAISLALQEIRENLLWITSAASFILISSSSTSENKSIINQIPRIISSE